MSEEEMKEATAELEELAEEMEETIPKPLGDTAKKKTGVDAEAHKVARAAIDAPMLEMLFPAGMHLGLNGIPFEVTKVNGMEVTLKRRDIVG